MRNPDPPLAARLMLSVALHSRSKMPCSATSKWNSFLRSCLPAGPPKRGTGIGLWRFTNAFAQLMEPLITSAAKKKALADVGHLKELAEAGIKR